MIKSRNRLIQIFATFACITIFIFGQTSLYAGTKKSVKDRYSNEEFNSSVQRVSVNYIGNDPVAVIKAAKSKSKLFAKDDFESNEIYKSKVDKIKGEIHDEMLPKSKLKYGGVFAFVVPLKALRIEYVFSDNEYIVVLGNSIIKDHISNQDIIRSIIGMDKMPLDEISRKYKPIYFVSGERYKGTGEYIGSNAFGSTAIVSKLSGKEDRIAFADKGNIEANLLNQKYLRLVMEPKVAKEAKDNLRVLYVCKLKNPYYYQGSNYSSATWDIPVQEETDINYLITDPIELILYNFKTGDIYKRFNISI